MTSVVVDRVAKVFADGTALTNPSVAQVKAQLALA